MDSCPVQQTPLCFFFSFLMYVVFNLQQLLVCDKHRKCLIKFYTTRNSECTALVFQKAILHFIITFDTTVMYVS